MHDTNPNFPDPPVLILAPMGNDARNAAEVLAKVSIRAEICPNMLDLCRRAGPQSGAFVISEEVFETQSLAALVDFLVRQPPWSDIPIILLTRTGEIEQKTFNILNFIGTRANVTLLEKPLRAITLVSVIKAALRSRGHQFEVRKLLDNYANALDGMQMATAKFWAVFDQSAVFAAIMALDGKVLEANQLCLQACGCVAAEVIGRPFWECGWWRRSTAVQEKIRAGTIQAATGTPYVETLPYVRADGTERILELRIYPIRDEKGQIIFLHPTGMDVTERKQAEEILRQNEALFSALVNLAPTGVYVVDADFRLQQINALAMPAFEKVQPSIGRDFSEVMSILWGPELGGKIVKIFRHTLETGERYISSRFSEFRQDLGTEKAYEWEVQRMTLPNGKYGVVCYFNDITERERALERTVFLSQLMEKLSVISDPDEISAIATRETGLFLKCDGCTLVQNLPDPGQVRVLTGWRTGDKPKLDGVQNMSRFGTAEWWHAVQRQTMVIEDVARDPQTKEFKQTYQFLQIAAYAMAPFIQHGRGVGYLAVCSSLPRVWREDDLLFLQSVATRVWLLILRAQVEGALRQSEERFRAMSDSIPQMAWMAEANGALFWYNQRWYDFTGTTFESMQGWGWQHVHHPEHLEHVISTWKHALASGQPWEDTFPIRGAEGNYRWFLSRAFPIRDSAGNIKLWFGTNTDVTDLREAQTALQQANSQLADKAAQLESLVQQRTAKLQETVGELEAFSYSIAHDMRSPLRSLQGFSDLLLEQYGPKIDPEGQHYLNRIANSATRLDKLIRDVLNYSKVVRAELPLEKVELEPLLRELLDTYPMLAPDQADIELSGPFPLVLGNQAMLGQIFANLMGNAVKFVPAGVRPRLKLWAESRQSMVRVFVQDNGIGIAPDQQTKIFGIFQQVDPKHEGTGIGLAVVKKAVERIGGRVGVQSELGRGSIFWIELKRG